MFELVEDKVVNSPGFVLSDIQMLSGINRIFVAYSKLSMKVIFLIEF